MGNCCVPRDPLPCHFPLSSSCAVLGANVDVTICYTQVIASLLDLLKASGIDQADLLELDESSLTELLGMAPLACRVPIGREIKAIREVLPPL